jgi:transcriptional regulator with XRE-family HTH domain
MPQHEGLGLKGPSNSRRMLRCLVDGFGPWPSAIYGLPKRRISPPGEAQVRARIHNLLKQRGVTQRRLAEQIGVTKQVISSALSGATSLPRAWIPQLAIALNVTERQLVQGICWTPRRGRPRRTGPPPPKSRRRESPSEKALRLRLRSLLAERKLTRQQIAVAIGVSRASVDCVLAARMALPSAWLEPLAAALKLTPSQITRGTGWAPRTQGKPQKKRRYA